MSAPADPVLRRGPFAEVEPVDWAIAGAFLVFGQLEVVVFGVPGDALAAHVLWAAAALASLVRRSHPLAFAVVGAVVLGLRFRYGLTPEGGAVFGILGLLAIYGAGAYADGAVRSLAYAALAAALQIGASVLVTAGGHGPMVGLPDLEWLGQISIFLAAAIGGVVLRDRSEALAAARQRAASVPSEASVVADALAEERAEIARELQALVSASVRRVLGELQRAADALARSADAASAALRNARELSQTAIVEMRRMLGVLRSGEPAATPPPMSLEPDTLDRLAARIPVRLRHQGMPLLVLAVGVPEALLAVGLPAELYGSAELWVRLVGAGALALAFVPRRVHPLVSTIAVGAVILARVVLLDDPFALNLPLYLAAFAAGAYGRSTKLAAAGGLIVVATAIATPLLAGVTFPVGAYVYIVATIAAAWLTGFGGRRRLGEADELHRLAAAEEAQRRRAAQRAVADERLRVARDLHDAVGHGLTSMTLQSAAGERLAHKDGVRAREAIANVEGAARETLEELDRLLAALGGDEVRLRFATDIAGLVERSRTEGLPVEMRVAGSLDEIPPGPSAAVYRIVQEALTNARKHGGSAQPVDVEIERRRGDVAVAVANTRDAARSAKGGGGHGLLGMEERVRIYGGELEVDAESGGEWVVRASIPLDELP